MSEQIGDRLSQLEQSNRQMKRSLVVLVCLTGIGFLAGAQASPKPDRQTLTVRKIQIVDKNGRPRIIMGVLEDDAMLMMKTPDGKKVQLLISASDEGSIAAFEDPKSGQGISVMTLTNATSMVLFRDSQGETIEAIKPKRC